MLSSICNDCKRLGKNCQGLKKDSTYTGCAQKETTLTFYGQQILKDFKERCKNVIGRDYFDRVCNSPDGTTMLNNCVASDEGLAAWLIFTYEDIPQEIISSLEKWSNNIPDKEISVILYSDRDMADEVESYTTTVGKVLKILEKAINYDNTKILEVTKDKKRNLEYWDSIDNLSEKYIKNLSSLGFDGNDFDESGSDIIYLGKKITEFATELLKTEYDYSFPYVEGDY